MRKHGTARRAFTLIELLVVIAIISLLVAMLIPSLEKARRITRRVLCTTQVRSIGQTLLMYAQDHNGWGLPRMVNGTYISDMSQWRLNWNSPVVLIQWGLLFDRVGQEGEAIPKIFMCPEDIWGRPERNAFGLATSYMLNPQASTDDSINRSTNIHTLPGNRALAIDHCIWGTSAYPLESFTNHEAQGINIFRADGQTSWVDIQPIRELTQWNWTLLDNVR